MAWNVYVRHDAKGLVLVNPSPSDQTAILPGAMWRVAAVLTARA